MDIQKTWQKALRHTEILRSRVQTLLTFQDTLVPYIFLSESQINEGDTVVRRGELLFEKPALILPANLPQFEGFDFDPNADFNASSVMNLLLIRGVSLPSLKYNNKTVSLDIFEGTLSNTAKHYLEIFQQQENVNTGLIKGPEDVWQFSVLIFICSQVSRNAETDVRQLLDQYKKGKTI